MLNTLQAVLFLIILIELVCLLTIHICGFVKKLFLRIFLWFDNRKAEETPVEKSEEFDFLNGSYDVGAFRQRIEKLMADEDGLYDIPEFLENKRKTDFTGVEVITPSAEMAKDIKVGG